MVELQELIQKAINEEELSYNMYMRLKEETQIESAKIMFDKLAKEELKHKAALLHLDITALDEGYHGSTEDLNLLDELFSTPQNEYGALEQAFEIAMSKELKAHTFYTELSAQSQADLEKQLFARMAQEEQHHHDLLKTEKEKMFPPAL